MKRTPIVSAIALVGVTVLSPLSFAEEQLPPPKVTCPVNTMTDHGGVQICHDDQGTVTVGMPVDPDIIKYPIGRSDKSVAKQVGNAVHHFFSHL